MVVVEPQAARPTAKPEAMASRAEISGRFCTTSYTAEQMSTGGSDVQDFVSGLLMGLSIVEMLAGIAVIGKKLLRG